MSFSIGGLVSGMDTDSMISQLMDLERKPIVQLQTREADFQVQLTAYGFLQSELNTLNSAVEKLDEVSDLTFFSATSGNTDLFMVSADDTVTAGSYSITVENLAQVHKLTSVGFSDGDPVGEGTIHLKLGSAEAVDISVSDTDTIDDVANAINDADAGVHAAVIFDGTHNFLTLRGEETGEANKISLTVDDIDGDNTDNSGLSRLFFEYGDALNQMSETQAAQDSDITVDGVSGIKRSTNTLDDVIEGLTITLKSAPTNPEKTADLTVSRNSTAFTSAVNGFVSAYNSVMSFFETNQNYDETTETAAPLLGDSTTNQIRNQLRDLSTRLVTGIESFSRLSDFGVTLNDQGHLEVDSSILNDAVEDHFEDAVSFFTKNTEGFAVRMVGYLENVLDEHDGMLSTRQSGINSSIDDIQEKVERMEASVEASEIRMRTQFASLEVLLGQYQTTSDYLSQQIVAMENMNNAIANK